MAIEKIRWLLPPNENYFLINIIIKDRSRMHATSKTEIFVKFTAELLEGVWTPL